MGLEFTEDPDFTYMKQLVTTAATKAQVDIFDNVFDWSLLLCMRDNQNNPLAH